MTNEHAFLSLYENPLAAGTLPADLQAETACHDRLADYLLGSGLNDESAIKLAAVESMPTLPPRVESIPSLPPRVESIPHVPPRLESIPSLPPRAHIEFSRVVSIPIIPPRA